MTRIWIRPDQVPVALAKLSMGAELTPYSPTATAETPALINCLGATPQRLSNWLRAASAEHAVAICDGEHASQFRSLIRTCSLPCSYETLLAGCR